MTPRHTLLCAALALLGQSALAHVTLGLALLQSLLADHAWSSQPQTELESA